MAIPNRQTNEGSGMCNPLLDRTLYFFGALRHHSNQGWAKSNAALKLLNCADGLKGVVSNWGRLTVVNI